MICRYGFLNMKLRELLKDLFERYVLGVHIGHCYVVEFQKRGLPHAHILLIIREEDKIRHVSQIDDAVQAVIPDKTKDPVLYELVTTHMIHRRCSASDICWDKEKNQCSKFFPKDICNESSFDPEGVYPHYRRPHMEPTPEGHTNQWVVPYNPWLLKKYRAHLNVEICASIKSVFYLFKYVHKGPDQANISVTRSTTVPQGNPMPPGQQRLEPPLVDEVTEFYKSRWIGSSEACWKIFGFSMGGIKPHVERLQIHLPEEQQIGVDPDRETAETILDKDSLRKTQLTEFFEMNRLAKEALENDQPLPFRRKNGQPCLLDTNPLDYLYDEFPVHFTWDKRKRMWFIREKGEAIGRIYMISPKQGDLYYCRLLLTHRRGVISFDNLRTIDGELLTYKVACVRLGLVENDKHCVEALEEAKTLCSPVALRGLFVTILLELHPEDPLALWEKSKAR